MSGHARVEGDAVHVGLESGRTVVFHAFALRDACSCSECRHPVSGQRLFETHEIVPRSRIARVAIDADVLVVDWRDGHRSVFDRAWLAAEGQPSRRLTTWDARLTPASERYEDVVASPEALRRLLAAVAEFGFAILTGVPKVDGAVAGVAELFGPVRVTNYGRIFDVAVRVDATNLADTGLALSLHTDNPYRDPPPGIQLLHCIESNVAGGETMLADGFRAVDELGARSPARLDLLAHNPVRFAYRDAGAELWSDVPVVELDGYGLPRALNLNNRSKGVPAGSPEFVGRWYEAYFALLDLLESADAQIVFRLEPGEVLVFDNLRVLHGRNGFSGGGSRRLQGCYADRDALFSTLAVLERTDRS